MTDDERTTVWLFITALVVGGAERTLVDLANGLDEETYDVTVWTIFNQNPIAADLSDHISVRTLNVRGQTTAGYVERAVQPVEYIRAPLQFIVAARREQPDIIHSFLYFDNIIARFAALTSSATVITGVRSVPKTEHILRMLLDRITLTLSDMIVSNSAAGAEFVIDRGAPEQQVTVIRNGRRIERFQQPSTNSSPSNPEMPSDAPVVGTVGRLIERKGCYDLITAWPRIRDRFPEARLVFVGDGPERAQIKEYAEHTACRDSITFLGIREDVPALLAWMDVFAFPSHYEGLPGALIEAMAAGLPIVTTPVDGNSELVSNYQTGLFVSPEKPEELAWAIIRLLEHQTLATTLGDAARERAENQFTIDRMVEEFEALYRQVE